MTEPASSFGDPYHWHVDNHDLTPSSKAENSTSDIDHRQATSSVAQDSPTNCDTEASDPPVIRKGSTSPSRDPHHWYNNDYDSRASSRAVHSVEDIELQRISSPTREAGANGHLVQTPSPDRMRGQHSFPGTPRQPTQPPSGTRDESLRRELHNYHIFLIAISAVIGMGFYVHTGTILHLGGEAAVVYSYCFLGALALMVMRGLQMMLRIWPIGGALVIFVEKFVDEEVGKSVAVLYWLTYCFSFAALTTTIGNLVEYFDVNHRKSVAISIVFVLLPVLANLTDVQIFGAIELILGIIKLLFALSIIIMMNVINPTVPTTTIQDKPQSTVLMSRTDVFHNDGRGGWFTAIASSVFLASFAFVGIEIVATTAQEAKFSHVNDSTNTRRSATFRPTDQGLEEQASANAFDRTTSNPFKFIIWVPIVATITYVWGGWIVSHNIAQNDPSLPDLLPIDPSPLQLSGNATSLFITSADRHSDAMGAGVTVLLIFTVASTSSTALYVAARTLFGFAYTVTKRYEGEEQDFFLKSMYWLSRKSKFDVPYRAVLVSSWLFWLPFLKYISPSTVYITASYMVSEMASVACILVWGFESLAAFQFYGYLRQYYQDSASPVHERVKSIARVGDNSWYYGHRIMSGLSACLCFSLILIGGSTACVLSPDFHQSLAAFLIVGVFILLTYIQKLRNKFSNRNREYRYPRFLYGVPLKDATAINAVLVYLTDYLKHNNEGLHPGAPRSKSDILGIVDSEWLREKLNQTI